MSTLDIQTPRWALPLLSPSRYKGAWGGRGSGKSHFFGEYIIENHIIDQNESTVCVREVQKSLDQSVKRLLEHKIEKLNAGWYFEVMDAKIRSTQGSGIITFQGMQNHTADSIKSLEGYKRAWVEEAQTLSQYSLDLLRPTLRVPGSELLFSWNPRFKTDPVDQFLRRNAPLNAAVVRVNWSDNPWFPAELQAEMAHDFAADPDKAEHVWNGAYGAGIGAILARWVNKADRDGRIHDGVTFDRGGAPIDVSSDIGFRDTASWWFWQRCLGGYRLLGYLGDSGLDADDWIPIIRDKILELSGGHLGNIWLPHDARAKTFQSKHTTVEKFLTAFPGKVKVVPQSKKMDQISAARQVIETCEFNKTACEAGIDGLTAWEFEWNEELNVFSRDPIHNWASHPSDGFAYGCQVMQMAEPKKEANEPKFAIESKNGRIVTRPLEELWRDTPKISRRI